jgi:excisionase family DNA binding protein
MSEMEGPALLSISDAAKRLGVHINTLRRWADQGEVKAVRLPSGYRRFEPAEVDRKRREMGFAEEPEP